MNRDVLTKSRKKHIQMMIVGLPFHSLQNSLYHERANKEYTCARQNTVFHKKKVSSSVLRICAESRSLGSNDEYKNVAIILI